MKKMEITQKRINQNVGALRVTCKSNQWGGRYRDTCGG